LMKVFFVRRISRPLLRENLSNDRNNGRALLVEIPRRREN
jgi:hypothetical protein